MSHLRLSFLFSLGLLDLDLRFDQVSLILDSSYFESCLPSPSVFLFAIPLLLPAVLLPLGRVGAGLISVISEHKKLIRWYYDDKFYYVTCPFFLSQVLS